MTITKQQLINTIHHIRDNVDKVMTRLSNQNKQIIELKSSNAKLKQINQNTAERINEYVKELEQIRKYYADSNNNIGK